METKIRISGGTVIAFSECALAVGHGIDGGDKGVELYANAKVTAGNSADEATLQTADKRSYGLTRHYANSKAQDFGSVLCFAFMSFSFFYIGSVTRDFHPVYITPFDFSQRSTLISILKPSAGISSFIRLQTISVFPVFT